MKSILYIIIFSLSTLLLSSCEKSESDHARHERLGIRADDCDYCPDNDCCCYVELINSAASANLIFCGTTNPDISTSVCGPIALESPCEPINGFYWTEDLTDPGNVNEFFCVEKGSSFMIGVGTSSVTSVRFTCQVGQLNPQFVTLLNLTAGEKRYYRVDDGCIIEECHLE